MNKGTVLTSAALAALGALYAQPAAAQFEVSVDGNARYEDNLFRISKEASDLFGLQRSDAIYTAKGNVTGQFDFGPQKAAVSLEVGHDWYNHNSNLNNTNYLASVDVQRSLSGLLGFSIKASAGQSLTPFNDLGLPVRNLQQVQQLTSEFDVAITPELRIVVTPSALRSANGNDTFRPSDYWQAGSGVGLGYFSPIGNSIAVTVSRLYTRGINDRFDTVGTSVVNSPLDIVDTSVDLRLEYAPSVLTKVSGVLSYVNRNDKSISNSDYKGLAGNVTLTYQPRDSLKLTLTGGRRLETQSFVFVEAIRNDFAILTTTFTLPDSTELSADGEFRRRQLGNDPRAVFGEETGHDRSFSAGLKAQRVFFERLRLNLAVSHEWRTATDALYSYHATVAQAGLALVFGKKGR